MSKKSEWLKKNMKKKAETAHKTPLYIQRILKGVTAKMSLSLSISGHTWVMESLKPRVKAFKEENDLNTLTLGPSLGASITKTWPEIERLSHIFALGSFNVWYLYRALD